MWKYVDETVYVYQTYFETFIKLGNDVIINR